MDETEPSDDTLVAASLNGDAKAFVQLVKRHDKATRGTVFATVGLNGPFDDALQEGLLKAYRSLRSYKQGRWFQLINATLVPEHQESQCQETPILKNELP